MNEILHELKKERFTIGTTMYIFGTLMWISSIGSNPQSYLYIFNIALSFISLGSTLRLEAKSARIKELEQEVRKLNNTIERSTDE
jgi:hypothetical protein